MDIRELINKYLVEKEVLQLATIDGDKPWICNLHYVADGEGNVYWISKPDRRHSQEIKNHSNVAAAVAVKSPDHPVVGLQIEGEASEVQNKDEIASAMRLYVDKFKIDEDFYNEVVQGRNPHKLYRLTPRMIVLFDEENFSDNPRQEWEPQND